MLQPPLRWRVIDRPPARSSTRAPIASRLLRRADKLQANPGVVGRRAVEEDRRGTVHVVNDDVDVAVVVESPKAAPRATCLVAK